MRRAWLAAASTIALLMLPLPAWADEPRAEVRGVEDATLRGQIERAVGTSKTSPVSRLEARARAREAAEAASQLLRSEGYYEAELTPDVSDSDPPRAILKIIPGTRFTFADPRVDWMGEAPTAEAQQRSATALQLGTGQAGRAADVLAAEGRAVATIQRQGYPDAAARPREVVVDHADTTVRPTFRIESGPLVRLDGVRLETEGRTNPTWVARLAPWKPGDTYTPDSVAELERRLLDAGVFESVTVGLAPASQNVDGLRPVIVSLADRPPRTLEVGAGYSTTEGFGLDGRWIHYNRFRRADTLTFTLKAAEIQQKLDVELALPHWRRPEQRLRVGGGLFGNRTDAFDDIGAGVRADVERRFGKTSYVTVGATFDYISTRDKTVTTPIWQNLYIATVLGAFALDGSDSVLDPRHGWRIEARLEPTAITGDVTLGYLKAQAQGSYYLPVTTATTIAMRARAGSILGGRIPEVPVNRRFFAGGGGSVRGYAYQGVGPRLANNTPAGGLSLVEGSVEVRQRITDRWGAVAFVDAGTISDRTVLSFNDLSVGAGVGVRYDLGFGPIRFDVAIPINRRSGDPSVQIYLSIGQSF